MLRARPWIPLVLVACGAGSAGCGGGAPAAPARPKNLLVVCIDTLRADHLGAYGAAPSLSPALDALAASGTVFEHAYAHAPWTLPSFAAILTSLYSSTNGCWTFESRLSDSLTTLPELFAAAGFDTYGIASHLFFNKSYGFQQGFAGFDDELCHGAKEQGWVPITSPIVAERAEHWLEQRASAGDARPWLLWLHFFDPHYPYLGHRRAGSETEREAPVDGEAADEARLREEHARYREEIAFTDGYVGQVLAALERSGFAADTAVVFVADHGEAFGEHPGVKRHGRSLYDEELRVPLVLRVPGLAPRRVSSFVRTVDLLPTLCELFGLRPGDAPIEGRSLLPALTGDASDDPPLLSELRLHDGFHQRSVIDGRYKLVEDVSNKQVHLYDLRADPGETTDLAPQQAALARQLGARLEELERRAAEKAVHFAPAAPVESTPEELERLRALGYVDGSAGEAGGGAAQDAGGDGDADGQEPRSP